MTGRLITLEGGEGAGKSTLLAGMREQLQKRGLDPLLTREPGGTVLGEAVRELVLSPDRGAVCAESELLLMFASRAQLVREVLQPALAAGRWVLCDRFTDASFAYQGAGRGQPQARIAELASWAAPLVPDLTLLLDIPVDEGLARMAQRSTRDRIEREPENFFERVRDCYRQRAADEPARFHAIDARLGPDAVLAQAMAAIDALREGRRA